MYDPDKYRSTRLTPSQARGKERVRIILAAALEIFKDRGIEEATTNEIAARANIPIGSLYRYYSNKDAIIKVLTELYVDDLGAIFADIAGHPLLPYFSWSELLFMLVDSWVHYSHMSGRFAFLYAERANPRLRKLNKPAWAKFANSFCAVLKKRCPSLTDRQLAICMQFALAASELGINESYEEEVGQHLHYEAIEVIACYLNGICERHGHEQSA